MATTFFTGEAFLGETLCVLAFATIICAISVLERTRNNVGIYEDIRRNMRLYEKNLIWNRQLLCRFYLFSILDPHMRDRLSRKRERQCPINSLYFVSKFSLPNPAKLPGNRQESFPYMWGAQNTASTIGS